MTPGTSQVLCFVIFSRDVPLKLVPGYTLPYPRLQEALREHGRLLSESEDRASQLASRHREELAQLTARIAEARCAISVLCFRVVLCFVVPILVFHCARFDI